MNRYDNELIFEAYKQKQIPLEESITAYLKNDLILANELYNEWTMSDAFNGFKKTTKNVGGFLMDKVKKYILGNLLQRCPEALSTLKNAQSKEDLSRIIQSGKDEAPNILNSKSSLREESYDGFWELILTEAKKKNKDEEKKKPVKDSKKSPAKPEVKSKPEIKSQIDPLTQKLLRFGRSLGREGIGYISDFKDDPNTDLTNGEAAVNAGTYMEYIISDRGVGKAYKSSLSKLISIFTNVKDLPLNPVSDDLLEDEEFYELLNNIGELESSEDIIQNLMDALSTGSNSKSQPKAEVNPKTKAIESKLAKSPKLKQLHQAAAEIAELMGDNAGAVSNAITTISSQSKTKSSAKGSDKKETKQQQLNPNVQALSDAMTNPTSEEVVNIVIAVANDMVEGKVPKPPTKKNKTKNKTATVKSEEIPKKQDTKLSTQETYKYNVYKICRLLANISKKYSKYAPIVRQYKKLIEPLRSNQIQVVNKDELQKPLPKNLDEAAKALVEYIKGNYELERPFQALASLLNGGSPVREDEISKKVEMAKQFATKYSKIASRGGDNNIKEVLLRLGVDRTYQDVIISFLKKYSEVTSKSSSGAPIEVGNSEPYNPETQEQDMAALADKIDDIARGDDQLKQDILKALKSAEERIKQSRDAEEKARRTEDLKNYLLKNGIANETNINHVMAVLSHIEKGGLVRPHDYSGNTSEAPKAQNPQDIRSTIKKLGSTSIFKILYDLVTDRSKMLTVAMSMGILYICFIIFGPAFLALLYVAVKGKQAEAREGGAEEEQPQQKAKEEPKQPSAFGNLKQAVKDRTSQVASTAMNAAADYIKPKPKPAPTA